MMQVSDDNPKFKSNSNNSNITIFTLKKKNLSDENFAFILKFCICVFKNNLKQNKSPKIRTLKGCTCTK